MWPKFFTGHRGRIDKHIYVAKLVATFTFDTKFAVINQVREEKEAESFVAVAGGAAGGTIGDCDKTFGLIGLIGEAAGGALVGLL